MSEYERAQSEDSTRELLLFSEYSTDLGLPRSYEFFFGNPKFRLTAVALVRPKQDNV